jgi:hypothetical protein
MRTLRRWAAFAAVIAGASAACTELKSSAGDGPAPDATEGEEEGGEETSGADSGRRDAARDGDVEEDPPTRGDGGTKPVCTETTCPVNVLQKDLHGPVAVAVDATHVYWVEVSSKIPDAGGYGQLVRLPKTSTCTQRSCYELYDRLLVTGELEGQYIYPTRLALGKNDVCYAQSYNADAFHTIRCFALADPKRRVLENGEGQVNDLSIDATGARWSINSSAAGAADGEIQGCLLASCTVATLAAKRVHPNAVTSDGKQVYWSELGAGSMSGSVLSGGPDGGAVPLATGRADPVSARVFGDHVYWIDRSAKKVLRVRTSGSGAVEVIATTDDRPFALAVDASGVYWASSGPLPTSLYGSVAHAPRAPNGKVTTMLTNISNVWNLATDESSVYVVAVGAKLGEGRLLRIAKTR